MNHTNNNEKMLELLSGYLSKGDVYAANAIAKVSMFIYKSRIKMNLTQKAFAKMMGVTQAMVSKWESAEYNFTIEGIAAIAAKLNTTFDIEFTPESEYLATNKKNRYEHERPQQPLEMKVEAERFAVAA